MVPGEVIRTGEQPAVDASADTEDDDDDEDEDELLPVLLTSSSILLAELTVITS